MPSFRSKDSSDRAESINRLVNKLLREQANEDTPQVDIYDVLRALKHIADHLVMLEREAGFEG